MRSGERGFTLIELVVGAAIAAIVLLAAVLLVSRLANWTTALDMRVQSSAAAERLMERLSTEAASAWAVYIPANDVNGTSNSDGHELDFYSQDGSHRAYAWAYTYDAQTKLVTRYAYAPGATPQSSESIGPFESFSASNVDVTQLPTFDPLFGGASATVVHYPLPSTSATGGNALVHLQLTASGVARDELLASGTAPTSFTVVVTYTPSPAPVPTAPPPSPTMAPAALATP